MQRRQNGEKEMEMIIDLMSFVRRESVFMLKRRLQINTNRKCIIESRLVGRWQIRSIHFTIVFCSIYSKGDNIHGPQLRRIGSYLMERSKVGSISKKYLLENLSRDIISLEK